MKISELKTGDIILQRAGHIGIFIEKNGTGYILYADSGYDEIDSTFNDDLTDATGDNSFDIMRIYRMEHGMIYFNDYEDGNLIFDRDKNRARPEQI